MTETVFEPTIKVTKQAIARRKKFVQNKFNHGLPSSETYMSKPRKVYFDDMGNITCVTKDKEFQIPDDWRTAEFTVDELRMISGNKSYSQFKVIEESGKFVIKAVKNLSNKSSRMAGELIEASWTTKDPLVMIKVEEGQIVLYLTDDGVEFLDGYRDVNYSIKGHNYLPLYVCAKQNPSFMIDKFDVSLPELASKHQISFKTSDDYKSFSIYTIQIFDSYGRI